MKKYIILLTIATSLIAVISCTKDNDDLSINGNSNPKLVETTLNVGYGENQTRAVAANINADNPSVFWESTDKVNVWSELTPENNAGHVFNINYVQANSITTKFTGLLEDNAKEYFAMYPNQSTAKIVYLNGDNYKREIVCNIPKVQYATPGSFDKDAAICVGYGNTTSNISLGHVCGYLKITINSECDMIDIVANNKTDGTPFYISGPIKVKVNDVGKSIQNGFTTGSQNEDENNSNKIRLMPSNGNTHILAGDGSVEMKYLIAVATGSNNGFTVYVKKGDTVYKSTTKAFTVVPSHVYTLGSFSVPSSN